MHKVEELTVVYCNYTLNPDHIYGTINRRGSARLRTLAMNKIIMNHPPTRVYNAFHKEPFLWWKTGNLFGVALDFEVHAS